MMKKILSFFGILALLIASILGGGIGKMAGKALVEPNKSTPKQVEQSVVEGFEMAAKELNQNTPTMIDKDTRIDSVSVGPGTRLTYHYTFPRYTSQEIDSSWILTNLRPEVKNKVCNSKEMKLSLQYGGIYIFSYSGNDGNIIASFEIDRNDCGFPKKTP